MTTPVTTIIVNAPSSSELSRNASVISTTSSVSSASSSSSASLIQPPTRPRPIRTYTGPQARNVPDVPTSSPSTPRQSVFNPEFLNGANNGAIVGNSGAGLPGASIAAATTSAPMLGIPHSSPSKAVSHSQPALARPTSPNKPTRSRQPSGLNTPQNYVFGRVLGEGSYSTVFEATSIANQQVYAIKMLDKRHLQKEKKVQYASSERACLTKLGGGNHPGIIRLYSAFQDASSLYFVLQFARGGDLLECLLRLGSFNVECTRYYAGTILDAVCFMHSMNIVHRDLKPENILLDDSMRIKVSDLGSAKDLDAASPANENGQKRPGSFVGTAHYTAPELLARTETGKPSDVWAFACLFFYLLAGRLPFKEPTDYLIFQKIQKGDYIFPEGFDTTGRELVGKLLVNDPTQRLTAPDIKDHPFFVPITDWKALWTISPPTLEAGLYKRPPPDPSVQGLNIGWANWVDGDMDGEEAEMDEPPPDHVVRRIAPEVIGVRVTRDEDAAPTTAHPIEAPEAVPKSSLDSGGQDLAGPLPTVASRVGALTTGETNSVGSYSSSEGQHGPWNSVASGGGNSSTSKGFELMRGMKGLSVGPNSSSPSAEWHLANGSPLLYHNEQIVQTAHVTTRIKRAPLLPAMTKRRLLILTSSTSNEKGPLRLLCIKESSSGGRKKTSVQDEFRLSAVTKVEAQGDLTLVVHTEEKVSSYTLVKPQGFGWTLGEWTQGITGGSRGVESP